MMLDNEVVGVLEFFTRSILESDDQILRMFAALGQQLGEFIGRTRAQEQLERFFTMSGDLLCIAGFDGYFTRVNESWHRSLGYTTTELMSRPFMDLVHQEDREATRTMFAGLMRGTPVQAFENRYRCKDGNYRWLSWTATPKPDEQLVYAVAHDATTRKLLEHQTQETLKMRNDFVSFVTHQLRTPLSGIKWMLELASETEEAGEKASYIGDARESANRLIGLVNDLLDASRLESGKLQVTIEPVRLREITDAVLGDLATLVREKGHVLDVASLPDLPVAMLDSQLMRQVILNLVSNAIKYTPPGGRIEIRMGREDRSLRWSIRDSGIGISPASQKRLFEKLFRAETRTPSTRKAPASTVSGLPIVERLVGASPRIGRRAYALLFQAAACGRRGDMTDGKSILLAEDDRFLRRAVNEAETGRVRTCAWPWTARRPHVRPRKGPDSAARSAHAAPRRAVGARRAAPRCRDAGDPRRHHVEFVEGSRAPEGIDARRRGLLDQVESVVAGALRSCVAAAAGQELNAVPRVLLAEDDRILRKAGETSLTRKGYSVIPAVDGEDALAKALAHRPDLILLDVMMPKMCGFDAGAAQERHRHARHPGHHAQQP
jgi:PAS domain S-box-containing protein